MNKFIVATGLVVSVALLSACSHKSTGTDNTNTAAGGQQSASNADMPQAVASTPDSAYEDMTTKSQYEYQWVARSSEPVDYNMLAMWEYGPEIAPITDTFKKQDKINSLKPMLEAALANAKAHSYIIIHGRIRINDYDMASKSFPLAFEALPIFGYNEGPDVQFRFTNSAKPGWWISIMCTDACRSTGGSQVQWTPSWSVPDEQTARQIEGILSANNSARFVDAEVYAFVQGTSGTGYSIYNKDTKNMTAGLPTLNLSIVKVVVHGPDGQNFVLK